MCSFSCSQKCKTSLITTVFLTSLSAVGHLIPSHASHVPAASQETLRAKLFIVDTGVWEYFKYRRKYENNSDEKCYYILWPNTFPTYHWLCALITMYSMTSGQIKPLLNRLYFFKSHFELGCGDYEAYMNASNANKCGCCCCGAARYFAKQLVIVAYFFVWCICEVAEHVVNSRLESTWSNVAVTSWGCRTHRFPGRVQGPRKCSDTNTPSLEITWLSGVQQFMCVVWCSVLNVMTLKIFFGERSPLYSQSQLQRSIVQLGFNTSPPAGHI